MRYAYIINPASGQGKHDQGVLAEIKSLQERSEEDIRYYFTEGQMDAAVLADAIAKEAAPEEVAIIACGGDGTIQEVANGLYGNDNAILGIYPCGSGNDFIRELGGRNSAARYLSVENQLRGVPKQIDLMRLSYENDGKPESRLIVNGINIGLDGNTAIMAHDLKSLPLVSGSFSYLLALLINFAGKKCQNLKVTADGEQINDGPLLLATVANGGYCGGGFNSCPYADLSDGKAEVLAIKDIPRRRFLALAPKYQKGKIFEVKGIEKLAIYRQAKKINIKPATGVMKYVADGEVFKTDSIDIEVVENAIRVLVIPEED